MALQKTIRLRGVNASYFYLNSLRYSRDDRSASATFGVCVSREHRDEVKRGESQPLQPIVAKVRLEGAQFDKYLGTGGKADRDIIRQLYKAARDGVGVISDMGPEFFGDANDI